MTLRAIIRDNLEVTDIFERTDTTSVRTMLRHVKRQLSRQGCTGLKNIRIEQVSNEGTVILLERMWNVIPNYKG